MKESKENKEMTPFSKWLQEAAFEGLLHKGGIRLKHIDKIKSEIFIFNNTEGGNPLCIFEVSKELNVFRKKSLLNKMPPWSLKLPGYVVLYRKVEGQGERPIENFRVRKFSPIERFVGDFGPREFAGFLASTVHFLRKKHERENVE